MKGIGIEAIILDNDLNEKERESILIKAIMNNNDEIVYQDVLELNQIEEIKSYENLEDFIEEIINTSKTIFKDKFNIFDISGISDKDNYLWTIRCILDQKDCFYTFKTTNNNEKFIETFVNNKDED